MPISTKRFFDPRFLRRTRISSRPSICARFTSSKERRSRFSRTRACLLPAVLIPSPNIYSSPCTLDSLVHLHLTFSGLVCILSLKGWQEQCPFTTRLRVLKLVILFSLFKCRG